jgi:cytochrome b
MSVQFETDFLCLSPNTGLLSTKEGQRQVLNSHDWEIDKLEAQNSDSILSKVHCSICGLERIFIVSNINESAIKAAQVKEEQQEEREEKITSGRPVMKL